MLISKGWKETFKSEILYSFESDKIFPDENIKMIFPRDNFDFAWKNIRNVLIENLCSLYDITEELLLVEFQSMNKIKDLSQQSDIIKAMFNHGKKMGSIPFVLAKNTLDNLYSLLLYSASYEFNPEPFCKVPDKQARIIVDTLNFPHTFDSSFGMGIELPINDTDNELNIVSVMPIQRKISKRIFSGLMSLDNAMKNQNIKYLLEDVNNGFNANMCESLSGITRHLGKNDIMFDLSLNGDIKSNFIYKPIQLNSDCTDILREAYLEIKKSSVINEVTVEGLIKILEDKSKFNTGKENNSKKQITIFWKKDFDKEIKVKIKLTNEQYELAIHAHKNHFLVSITGDLIQKRNEYELKNPKNLNILPK